MSTTPDYLVVYGDSYSDIQPETKRTNGPLWSQQLASQWNTKLVSLAQPGATFCRNNRNNGSWLKKQIETYSISTKEQQEESAIHAIFLGVTELIETKGEVKNIKEWIQCIKDQVTFLCSSNPNSKVIVMGVPALEFSPYAMTHKSVANNLKQNIIDFNVALEEEVLDWHEAFNNNVQFFDTYLVFSDLLGDPSIANIDNVDNAYWDHCQGKCSEKMDTYLWWDTVHVTGAGHKAISNTIQSKEFFNLKATSSGGVDGDTTSSLDSNDALTGLPKTYARCLSWIILGSVILMILYMFRHNRVILSLKKKLQSKAAKVYSPNNRNNHEYTLV